MFNNTEDREEIDFFGDVYPFMKAIVFEDSQDEFIQSVENRRKILHQKDIGLLKKKSRKTYTLNNLVLQEGQTAIKHGGFVFDCVFKYQPGPLYVILNGGLTGKIPEFKRWTYYKYIRGSMLNIADPMYHIFPRLKVAWYYGDEEENLREYLAEVVLKYARLLGISRQSIYIIGSSAGGTAAIHLGHLIPGSMVIAINAQIKMSLYFYQSSFSEITGISMEHPDPEGRDDVAWCLEKKNGTKYLIVSNMRSERDLPQVEYLRDRFCFRPEYGLTQVNENCVLWIYDAKSIGRGGAHGAQETKEVFYTILFLADLFHKGKNITSYKSLYLLFGEFWSSYYEQMAQIAQLTVENERGFRELPLSSSTLHCTESQLVVAKDQVQISAGQNEHYKHTVVSKELKDNSVYCLCLGASHTDDENNIITIIIKDLNTDSVVGKRTIQVGEPTEYTFFSGNNANGLSVRIYCGPISKTEGHSVTIDYIRLFEVKDY